jgi:hypothetical protein
MDANAPAESRDHQNSQNLSITLFITAVMRDYCRVKLANRHNSEQEKIRLNSYLQINAIANQAKKLRRDRDNVSATLNFDYDENTQQL